MNIHILQKGLCVASMFLLASCGTYSTSSVQTPDGKPPPKSVATAKPSGKVIITENNITDRPYVSLGDISVTVRKVTIFDGDPTREKVALALQEKAAEMGADAVVLVRYGALGIGLMSWGQMEGQGRAVSFRQ